MNSEKFFMKACNIARKGWLVREMKELCRELKLPVSGTKQELCDRLTKYFKNQIVPIQRSRSILDPYSLDLIAQNEARLSHSPRTTDNPSIFSLDWLWNLGFF